MKVVDGFDECGKAGGVHRAQYRSQAGSTAAFARHASRHSATESGPTFPCGQITAQCLTARPSISFRRRGVRAARRPLGTGPHQPSSHAIQVSPVSPSTSTGGLWGPPGATDQRLGGSDPSLQLDSKNKAARAVCFTATSFVEAGRVANRPTQIRPLPQPCRKLLSHARYTWAESSPSTTYRSPAMRLLSTTYEIVALETTMFPDLAS